MPLLYEKGRFGIWYWENCSRWVLSLKWLILNPDVRNCMIGRYQFWWISKKHQARCEAEDQRLTKTHE